MTNEEANEEVKVAPLSVTQLALDLDEQWPSLKYLGFGCYYAWIYLCYNSDILFTWSAVAEDSTALLSMYLVSTTGLSIVLILSAIAHRKATHLVEGKLFVVMMACVATASTLLLSLAVGRGAQDMLFLVACFLTGVSTAFIALRLGCVYSAANARQAFMYTAGSFLFAGMLYFVAVGMPHPVSLIVVTILPLLAALFTMTVDLQDKDVVQKKDAIPLKELPAGFFPRLVLVVAVFSVVGGLVKGILAMNQPLSMVNDSGCIIVFATGVVAIILFLAVGVTLHGFDISRLYYPIIILACFGILAVPLLGTFGPVQGQFVSVAYNLFIMVVWCLLAHVGNRTDLSPVQVFGWGRGASGAGTTIGWAVGSIASIYLQQNASAMVAVAIGMVLVLLVVSMVVLNERTLSLALLKTSADEADSMESRDVFPRLARNQAGGTGDMPDDKDAHSKMGTWTKSCNALADRCKLSDRERQVLFLLAKGRTIDYIANDLGISFNTAKSHIRHVYVKAGVHSRQDLLSIVEAGRE